MTKLTILLAMALPAAAQSPRPRMPIPISVFEDPQTGVRFEYPIVWKQASSSVTYFAPSLLPADEPPKILVGFLPTGNLYEKTNLDGISFLFIAPVVASQQQCLDRIRKDTSATSFDTRTIHGILYQHASGGDAGMCHQQSFDTYATYQRGRCLLFEEDFDTTCAFPEDGIRPLTNTEGKALQGHLDAIMQSVTVKLRQPALPDNAP